MEQAKFGIEAEYALVRPDGRFADFTNTQYSEVCGLIDPLPDYRHPELRVGDAGIRVKNWYVEGDERFDECGRCTGLAFKGIEIRTAVFPTIEKSIASLRELRSLLEAQLQVQDWSYVTIGFNPYTRSYEPTYTPWERTFQASHIAHHLPEISTLSYGPDLNFSCSSKSPEQVLEIVRRLTYYSPFIVPFSFSSPFVGGALWDGLSYRTYRRTGERPAALAHLASSHEHPLVKEANPASQHLRVEFKAFDMVADDHLLAELFYLILGISIADPHALPGGADLPNKQLHQQVALTGFSGDDVHKQAVEVLAAAQHALGTAGYRNDLPLLQEMLALRLTPAHSMREHFMRTGSVRMESE
jgi:hypothetical protein